MACSNDPSFCEENEGHGCDCNCFPNHCTEDDCIMCWCEPEVIPQKEIGEILVIHRNTNN